MCTCAACYYMLLKYIKMLSTSTSSTLQSMLVMSICRSCHRARLPGAQRQKLQLADPVLAVALAHPIRALLAAGGRAVTESSTVAAPWRGPESDRSRFGKAEQTSVKHLEPWSHMKPA